MMKALPLCLLLLLPLAAFTVPESCETLKPGEVTIYPLCGNRATYIHRKVEAGRHIVEEVFVRGERRYHTELWLNAAGKPDSGRLTGYEYWKGKLEHTEMREELEAVLRAKEFRVNDTLLFAMSYHDNGAIMQYGLKRGYCWLYCVDTDPANHFFWKGAFVAPVTHTVNYKNPAPGEPSSRTDTQCGDRTGMWKKLDAHGMVVDSVDMTGSVSESASWRRMQQLKGGQR